MQGVMKEGVTEATLTYHEKGVGETDSCSSTDFARVSQANFPATESRDTRVTNKYKYSKDSKKINDRSGGSGALEKR